MKILLTGGGTGGHIYPLIAVAQKLKELSAAQSIEIRLQYMGPVDVYSAYIAREGIAISPITNAKLRRYVTLLNLIDGPKFLWSVLQALIKVALWWPHIAFSKGGPGALPVLCACRLYGIPIIIHESDTIPGLTNKITGAWARKIELGWQKTQDYFTGKNTAVVGVPQRNELVEKIQLTERDAKIDMHCDPHTPLILIVGGSQGSERINEFILKNLRALLTIGSVIHQIGSEKYPEYMTASEPILRALPPALQNNYHPYAYLEEAMGTAYRAADCIVSRSGSVIFEIAAFGKPSILIPLPEAANDHQRINAEEYAQTGAAFVMEEKNLHDAPFIEKITAIVEDKTVYDRMASAAVTFAKQDTAEIIARDILTNIP